MSQRNWPANVELWEALWEELHSEFTAILAGARGENNHLLLPQTIKSMVYLYTKVYNLVLSGPGCAEYLYNEFQHFIEQDCRNQMINESSSSSSATEVVNVWVSKHYAAYAKLARCAGQVLEYCKRSLRNILPLPSVQTLCARNACSAISSNEHYYDNSLSLIQAMIRVAYESSPSKDDEFWCEFVDQLAEITPSWMTANERDEAQLLEIAKKQKCKRQWLALVYEQLDKNQCDGDQ